MTILSADLDFGVVRLSERFVLFMLRCEVAIRGFGAYSGEVDCGVEGQLKVMIFV